MSQPSSLVVNRTHVSRYTSPPDVQSVCIQNSASHSSECKELLIAHADLDAGWAQRLVTKRIAFAGLFNNGAFGLIAVLDSFNCLMQVRIKWFAYSWYRIDTLATHHFVHLPVEHA